MDRMNHTLAGLFAQLGIENAQMDIDNFIILYRGIPENITLSKANIWSDSQAIFLEDSIQEDSDWAEVVDQFDCLLRQ